MAGRCLAKEGQGINIPCPWLSMQRDGAERRPSPHLIYKSGEFQLWPPPSPRRCREIICLDRNKQRDLSGGRSELSDSTNKNKSVKEMRNQSRPLRKTGGKERMFLCLTYEQRAGGKWGVAREKGKAVQPLWQLVHGALDWTQSLILPIVLGRCHFKCSWT